MRFKHIDDRDRCVEMMVEAAKSGINYFDTAPGYFGTKGEEVFGQGFAELKRIGLPFFCSTKTFKSSEKQIRKEIAKQLKRLNVDTIDFYHMWSVLSLENWKERKQHGAVRAFQRLKDEGLIRHMCVSSHLAGNQIKELLAEGVFEGVLFGYSAYNFPFRQAALEAVASQQLGCGVMNPLGGGVIPQNPQVFDFVKTRREQTVVEAALHFLFAHPEFSTVLVGFSELSEVREAVRAVENYDAGGAVDVDRIKGALSESLRDLCTGCQYCDHCPEGIPVPVFMEVYNHKLLYGTTEAVLRRLKMHWNLPPGMPERCTACGQCEEACTQHLPIIERLKELASLASGV